MDNNNTTPFSYVYDSFLSKITDDMYMELTKEDTYKMLEELLISAIPKFEFPRVNLFDYEKGKQTSTVIIDNGGSFPDQGEENILYLYDDQIYIWNNTTHEYSIISVPVWNEGSTDPQSGGDINEIALDYTVGHFNNILSQEEINILATYMIVEWLGYQLASIENVRMKFSGTDFKFTSQANHMQKLLVVKKDYEREGFHLQRLYKRRKPGKDGIMRSTFDSIVAPIDKE